MPAPAMRTEVSLRCATNVVPFSTVRALLFIVEYDYICYPNHMKVGTTAKQ